MGTPLDSSTAAGSPQRVRDDAAVGTGGRVGTRDGTNDRRRDVALTVCVIRAAPALHCADARPPSRRGSQRDGKDDAARRWER